MKGEPDRGLLAGLTPYLIGRLTDNPWDGGSGYTPNEVGDMTLDQIFMRLVETKRLRKTVRQAGTTSMAPEIAASLAGKDGMVKGRAHDGTPIRGRVGGLSRAQEIRAADAAKAKGGE